jgi:hypothetical protein
VVTEFYKCGCGLVMNGTNKKKKKKGNEWKESHARMESHTGVFKKRLKFCCKGFILQQFKHSPLQSSPLYWRYTVPTVSSIFGMFPGTHFL